MIFLLHAQIRDRELGDWERMKGKRGSMSLGLAILGTWRRGQSVVVSHICIHIRVCSCKVGGHNSI
jgi:hypothetical protein